MICQTSHHGKSYMQIYTVFSLSSTAENLIKVNQIQSADNYPRYSKLSRNNGEANCAQARIFVA